MAIQFTMVDRPSAPQLVSIEFGREVLDDDSPWDADCEEPEYVLGVQAVALISIPIGNNSFHLLQLRSAGLWGVGVDSRDDPYLDEVYHEELAQLKAELAALGKALTEGVGV